MRDIRSLLPVVATVILIAFVACEEVVGPNVTDGSGEGSGSGEDSDAGPGEGSGSGEDSDAGSDSGSPGSPGEFTSGNTVLAWVEHTLETVRADHIGTPFAGRLYAMVTAGMFDAVNAIDRAAGGSHSGFTHAVVPPDGAPSMGHRGAAVVACAFEILSDRAGVYQDALKAARDMDIEAFGGMDNDAVSAGVQWGTYVGQTMLEIRAGDGTDEVDLVYPGTNPGEYHKPFNRAFADMTPFVIHSGDPYTPRSPPSLSSGQYFSSHKDVRTKGGADDHQGRNTIAEFFFSPAGTVRPTGLWLQAAIALAKDYDTVSSVTETARLMALVAMATADTIIPIWEGKGLHYFWRPYYAIRYADSDGNRLTTQDSEWVPRNASVGDSGEYPSGFAAFSTAAATVFEYFYGTAELNIQFESDMASGPRNWTNVYEAADEGGRSRVYQGVHFQFTIANSRSTGAKVAQEVVSKALQPLY